MMNKENINELKVSIFPGGAQKPEVFVHFDSHEEKQHYIKKEASYCEKEYNDYLSSTGVDNRGQTKDVFLKKRAEFATKMGYAPTKTMKTVWKKTAPQSPTDNNNSVA